MKQSITTEKSIYDSRKEESFTAEFSLPEYLPGIARIIKTDTIFEKSGFHTEGSKAFMDISVKFSIVYLSDFGGKIKCAVFDEQFNFPLKDAFDYDGEYTAVPTVYSSGLTSKPVSSRKVQIKGTLVMSCTCYAKEQLPLYSKDESDTDIFTLTKQISLCQTESIQSGMMSASAEINLEKDTPPAQEIILPKASIHSLRCTASDGSLKVSAILSLHALYECSEEENAPSASPIYACVSSEADFETELEDGRIKENCLCNAYIDIVSIDCSASFDSYGESRILAFDIKYILHATFFENITCNACEDVFSSVHKLFAEYKSINSYTATKQFHCAPTVKETVHGELFGLHEISCCFVTIRSVAKESMSDKAFALAKCLLEVLGTNVSGELVGCDIPVTLHIPIDECENGQNILDYLITVCSCKANLKDGALETEFVFDINGVCKTFSPIKAVCSITKDSERLPEKNKGEIIVCYPSSDDTVWSLAKKYAVSPDALKSINGMDTDTQAVSGVIIVPQ